MNPVIGNYDHYPTCLSAINAAGLVFAAGIMLVASHQNPDEESNVFFWAHLLTTIAQIMLMTKACWISMKPHFVIRTWGDKMF